MYKGCRGALRGRTLRFNFIIALMTGMLFCTLSTLEVPEFLRLTDDTSNDYFVAPVQETAPTPVQSPAPGPVSNPVVAIATAVPRLIQRAVRFQSRGSAPSVDDFLHSLCILRT